MRIHSPRRIASPADHRPIGATLSADADTRLGPLLVESGVLTIEQAETIAAAQQTSGARFGQTAVRLGLVAQPAIDRAVARQFDFSIVDERDSRLDPALIAASGGQNEESELIRSLRAKLWVELTLRHERPFAVTVAGVGDGIYRSIVTANLAIASAQAGVRTLLVDGDLRNPAQHRLFGVPSQTGLSTFLAGRQAQPTIVPIAEIKQLAVCPAGPLPPNPKELLSRMGASVDLLREAWRAELILFDAASLDDVDDAYLIAEAAPAVLVVARQHLTRSNALVAAHRQFAAANAHIIGSVLHV